MKNSFEDFRSITLLVSQQKNIAIFPISKTDEPIILADGTVDDFGYKPAYYPIELPFPYSNVELAKKIKNGIEEWGKHKCYEERPTLEEKYYEIKGFKNAVKGNRYMTLGWDDIQGKYVSFMMPLKSGYGYLGLDTVKLSDDANWIDFADAVIHYINLDITTLDTYKTFKRQLNT